ncbi:SMEK domain-containing protein [Burkholderia multivorans]|uniref:SMEK domain-containing protein n=1 Tax=Burkholderia multivorans TaxID=87883 RepID=UPI001FC84243|nr:SMEK domain-containing protein [Burkholderia multivorans]MCA8415068.1 SMEK domain-containing protein [Burkholderia multivorans]MDN7965629.1 SMEK domain-containing protein [Burkholderia multivorans]
MKHLDLLNEFRQLMALLEKQVEASSAMGSFDIHKAAEGLVLGVLRELYGWKGLRNLNATEKVNFPGIDLADDDAGIAIQVTGTPTLDKIKATLETFLRHGLEKRYQRLLMYVLVRKQSSYSKDAIERTVNGKIDFDIANDIVDMRDICAQAASVEPSRLSAALEVVREYMRGGVAAGLSEEDFDPPSSVTERATLNLLEVYFPRSLYIADLRDDIMPTGKRIRNQRKHIRETLLQMGLRVPSCYEVNGRQLITFLPLDESQGPFAPLVDLGTVTPLRPHEFYGVDEDRERIFKSLLRFTLQQKLYQHRVQWMHEDNLFAFLPHDDADLLREETWTGLKKATRRVYERKINKSDSSRTFICKHFAFAVDFLLNDGRWYVALTPDWYFSHGDNYRRSRYADESLAWLKKTEVNRTVTDHFRFLTSWLIALDQEDLFAAANVQAPTLTFGDTVSFASHPALPDESWLPLRDASEDNQDSPIMGLFEAP